MLASELGIPKTCLFGNLEGLQTARRLVLCAEADQPNWLSLAFIEYRHHAKGLFLAPFADVGCDPLSASLETIQRLAHQSNNGILNDVQVAEVMRTKGRDGQELLVA